MSNQGLLQQSIASLPFSDELKALLASKGYTNLQDILRQKVSYLRNNDGLNLHHELEIFNLIKENGLEEMWKEE